MQTNPVNHTDIPLLLVKIQQRLSSLENKIDILVGRVQPARADVPKPPVAQVQKPAPVNPGNAGRQDNANRGRNRMMHKTICADCKKECEVPFKPSGDRPVYCRECFALRKANNSLRPGTGPKPQETSSASIDLAKENQMSGKAKPVAKKKAVAKKKPAAEKKLPNKKATRKVAKKKN